MKLINMIKYALCNRLRFFMTKRVGIIIPIYNVSQFLDSCLESVLNQTYADISIICVNDGSTDNSFDILMKYFHKDKRIVVIDKINGGLSSARNVGIDYLTNSLDIIKFEDKDGYYIFQGEYTYRGCFKHSKQEYEGVLLNLPIALEILSHTKDIMQCDYIHFLDSDDLLCFNCIDTCMQFATKHQQIDIVLHKFFNIQENDVFPLDAHSVIKCEEYTSNTHDLQYERLSNIQALDKKLQTTDGFSWHGLVTIELLRKYNIRFMNAMFAEDQLFAFMIFSCARETISIPHKLYAYRIRSNSIMTFNPNLHKFPPFKSDIFNAFNNKELASMYDKSYSWLSMANALYDFTTTCTFDDNTKQSLQKGIIYLTPRSVKALYAIAIESKDPKNAKNLFTSLIQNVPKNHFKFRTKIAFSYPILYKMFYYVKKVLKSK